MFMSLLIALTIMKIMIAMIRKLITAEMKLPNAMGPTLRTFVISSIESTPITLPMMS